MKTNGLTASTLRSSELWADTSYSKEVKIFKPLDVMLYNYNYNSNPFGAHVAVYIGDGKII